MKYLKDFNNLINENYNNDVTFEILYSDNKLLSESINYYEKSEKGKPSINIILSDIQHNKLKNIKNDIDKKLREINNFEGIYINESGQIIKRIFEIKYNDHWIRRFMRKDIDDPTGKLGIMEPDKYEGIDLIYNNRNKLTKLIFVEKWPNDFKVLLKAKDKYGYELIFILKKEGKMKYQIIFITQMKGIGHNYKYYNPNKDPIQKIIKL